MDPMSILFPVLSVGGMGVVFGACLGVASEVFKVEEDPRIGQVLECLPGANCGGCGFPGCGGCRYSSCKCLPRWWRSSC